MALNVIGTIGWFLTKKTLDGAYNTAYHIIFGSESNKIDKKLDKLLKQNEILKKEINILKYEKNEIINYENNNFNIVIIDEYCSIENSLNKNKIKKLYDRTDMSKSNILDYIPKNKIKYIELDNKKLKL